MAHIYGQGIGWREVGPSDRGLGNLIVKLTSHSRGGGHEIHLATDIEMTAIRGLEGDGDSRMMGSPFAALPRHGGMVPSAIDKAWGQKSLAPAALSAPPATAMNN